MTSTHPLEPDLLLRHAGFVRAVARAAIQGDADVDDVVQDTWLALLQGGPRRPGPLEPWLAKVTRRRAADVHRRRGRIRRREQAAARPEAQPSTAELASRAELGRRVVDAVLALKVPYRDALLLRYYDDLPPRKVAARLGTPVETARTRVRRGLEQIRDRFDAEHDGDRRTWMAALLPLVPSASVAPTSSGVLLGLGLGKLLLIAAAVVVGIALVWRASQDADVPHVAEEASEEAPPPTLVGRARTESAESTRSDRVGAIRGRVLLAGAPQVCRVELRRIQPLRDASPLRWFAPAWLYAEIVGEGAPVARKMSDADGRFAFERVDVGTYEVRALGDEQRVATAAVHLRGRALGAPLVLELPGGPVLLRGRAVYADGRPFQGWIRVHVARLCTVTLGIFGVEMLDGQGLVPVTGDGRFEIRGIPPTTVRLAAMRPGDVRYVSAPVTLPMASPYTFVVDEGMGTLHGQVVAHEDGRPIPGAHVEASARSSTGARVHAGAQTDREGRFRLVLPDAELALTVQAPGRATARRGTEPSGGLELHSYGYMVSSGGVARSPLGRPTGGDIVVRLLKAPRVEGTVREAATGAVVAGVPVMGIAESFPSTGGTATTRTDASGRYVLEGLAPGPCAVFAAGSGWVSEGLAFVPEAHAPNTFLRDLAIGEVREVDLVVVPAARVSGRVLDAEGHTVPGAAVAAMPRGAFPPLAVGSPQWLGVPITDAEGRFAFDTLLPGFTYRFHAEAPGFPLASTKDVALGLHGLDDLEIRLQTPRWLVARVLDAGSGEPIPGARIHVRIKGAITTAHWWTGSQGRALVGPLPSGSTKLFAKVSGYGAAGRDEIRTADAAERAPEVVIRLARSGTLRGRVKVPEGVPPHMVTVVRYKHRDGRRRRIYQERVYADAAGNFLFVGLSDGTYELVARTEHDGRVFEASLQAQPGDTDLELALVETAAGTRWVLKVLDPGGEPVYSASAVLHVRRSDGAEDSDDSEVLEGRAVLRPGEHFEDFEEAWLDVVDARDGATAPLDAGAVVAHPLPSGGGAVEVRLPPALRIVGLLRGPNGESVAGARVLAYPPGVTPMRTRPDLYAHARARTREDGHFTLDRLADVIYRVTCLLPPTYLPVEPVEARPGGRPLVFEPALAARPVIEVRDAAGTAVGGARVVALATEPPRGGGRHARHDALTDAAGRARLSGLVPGAAYRLDVDPPGDRADLARLTLPAWRPGDQEVTLAPAGVVSGHIRDAAGEPILHARLGWRMGEGGWKSERLADDGAFRLGGLPLGADVELFARTGFDGGGDPPARHIRRVRAGDEGILLTAYPSARVILRIDGDLEEDPEVMASLLPHGGHPMVTSRNAKGVFEWREISPVHRCLLYVADPIGGRYGLLEDVDPLAGPHVVTLHEAEDLRGRVRGAEGAEKLRVWANRIGLSASAVLADDGTFVLRGLCPGAWMIHASARVGGTYRHVEIEAHPGETVTIDLE